MDSLYYNLPYGEPMNQSFSPFGLAAEEERNAYDAKRSEQLKALNEQLSV